MADGRSTHGRPPPSDLDAEAMVLSAILLDPRRLDEVLEVLRDGADFYSESNGKIYSTCVAIVREGRPLDLGTVASRLRREGKLDACGGAAYLAQIVDAVPVVAHVVAHAKTVRDLAVQRRTIAEAQRIAAEGYGNVGEVREWVGRGAQALTELADAEAPTDEPIAQTLNRIFEGIRQQAERGQATDAVSTGIDRLDEMMGGGLRDGDLTIVAARPGMGKSALAMSVAVNVAAPRGTAEAPTPGDGACVFSLEMPREQLVTRAICSEGRVDLGKLRKGHLRADDWSRLTEASSFLSTLPLWIDDRSGITPLDIRARVRRRQREAEVRGQRVRLVVVDYLQLMRGGRGQNREQQVSDISREMKCIARDLRVPVVCLSQLSRAVETRPGKNKRPQLSDLRESGAIEQDADNIIFVYRDEYYDHESKHKGLAELIVAKQRNGPTGKVFTRFFGACTRFDNLAPGEYPKADDEE